MSELSERLREGAQVLLHKASDLQERIRRRAHAIWEREGRPHGRDEDHWRAAESELANEEAAAASGPSAAKKPRAKSQGKSAAERAKPPRAAKPAAHVESSSATEVAAAAKPAKARRAVAATEGSKAAAKPRRVAARKDRS